MTDRFLFSDPESDEVFWSPEIEHPAAPRPKRRSIDFRSRLNPAQYEAVTTTEGPVLVVAGAGSGKTRTLVHRVAYLVEQGTPPEAILLLTFTRKAAAEMLHRAGQLVGSACSRVSGGTFHSMAHLLLRTFGDRLGYPPNFGIMDRGDMEDLLGQLRKQSGLGEKDRRFPRRSTLATIISKASNKNVPLERLIEFEYPHLKDYTRPVGILAGQYAAFKKENALLDFDDLLLELARLLRDDDHARKLISGRYQYIMVDEYQDTNPVQAEIIRLLGQEHGNVMVVGDDAQSIYSFRGATFRNIMDFPEIFKGTRIIRLEENYRSRQPVLDLTNYIISQAREKYDKRLFTRKEGGEKPHLVVVDTSTEQSLFVCRKIREFMDQGIEPEDMAVLFRAASHSFDLEIELQKNGIDFVKYGGRKFLESAHVKDLLSTLRIVANPSDAINMTRALLMLDGVGPKTANDIAAWIGGRREKLLDLKNYPARGKVKDNLAPLADLMERIAGRGARFQERFDAARDFYQPILETRYDDHPSRQRDIDELKKISEKYTSLTQFLADMTLEPPNASISGRDDGRRRLTLSTVHSAKGLEWKVVFIIWASEGRFPAVYARGVDESMDEERRLMYVAATRAEEYLFFICPLETDDYRSGVTLPRPSCFLDVPPSLFASGDDAVSGSRVTPPRPVSTSHAVRRPVSGGRASKPERTSLPTGSSSPVSGGTAGQFTPGQRVTHPVFGLGRVLNVMGGEKIRVDFDHFGPKTLHAVYAGLKCADA